MYLYYKNKVSTSYIITVHLKKNLIDIPYNICIENYKKKIVKGWKYEGYSFITCKKIQNYLGKEDY